MLEKEANRPFQQDALNQSLNNDQAQQPPEIASTCTNFSPRDIAWNPNEAISWIGLDVSDKRSISKRRFQSQTDLLLCGGYYELEGYQGGTDFRSEQQRAADFEKSPTIGDADSYEYTADGQALLCGDVRLKKSNLTIESQQVFLNEKTQVAKLEGRVKISGDSALLAGQSASYNFETKATKLSDALFLFYEQMARGQAQTITDTSDGVTVITNGSYTTCPPGNNDWLLEGQKIKLNRETGWGSVKHMKLKLGKVPVLYVPYFKFPIDDKRHTGFLYPQFNSLSEPDISAPFYWNIAPNYDWLITPRRIGGRGLMWENQFRYLSEKGEGEVQYEILPNDKKKNEQRQAANLTYNSELFDQWYLEADIGYVSDADFFDDLGTSLSTIGESFINREAIITHQLRDWSLRGALTAYQTIDAALTVDELPYRKLPEIQLTNSKTLFNGSINWENALEYAYLEQPKATLVPYAHRAHWRSEWSYLINQPWMFFKPSVTLQHSQYRLSRKNNGALNNTVDTEDSESLSRTLPTISIDSGLVFEKTLAWKDREYLQTLEPRLYHTYTPFDEQNLIPIFDTTELTFGFDQLFRPSRFSGIDRIGDTHQTTAAITTRLFNAYQQERLQLTLGQILYHKDQRVQLTEASPTNTLSLSPIVMRATATIDQTFTVSTGLTWNSRDNILEDGNIALGSSNNQNRLWHLGYRYRKALPEIGTEQIQQTQFGMRYAIKDNWHWVGAWQYDWENKRTLEQVSGFQFEDCCWKADLLYHRRIRSNNDLFVEDTPNRYAFLIQVQLKGLGIVGGEIPNLLSRAIPGLNLNKIKLERDRFADFEDDAID